MGPWYVPAVSSEKFRGPKLKIVREVYFSLASGFNLYFIGFILVLIKKEWIKIP